MRLYLEIAADGVEIRANSTNGTQIFLIKCKDMLDDFIANSKNVLPLLIIPGPKAPKSFEVYWRIIFDELFIRYGPGSQCVAQRFAPPYILLWAVPVV
jgi:hypothetical protein